MNNPKAKTAIQRLLDEAYVFSSIASHKNKQLGPGKFIEKFATDQEKENLKDLVASDLGTPNAAFVACNSNSKCSVCWDSLRAMPGKCPSDRNCPYHRDFVPTGRKSIFSIKI
jgi:hypothetical protein